MSLTAPTPRHATRSGIATSTRVMTWTCVCQAAGGHIVINSVESSLAVSLANRVSATNAKFSSSQFYCCCCCCPTSDQYCGPVDDDDDDDDAPNSGRTMQSDAAKCQCASSANSATCLSHRSTTDDTAPSPSLLFACFLSWSVDRPSLHPEFPSGCQLTASLLAPEAVYRVTSSDSLRRYRRQ